MKLLKLGLTSALLVASLNAFSGHGKELIVTYYETTARVKDVGQVYYTCGTQALKEGKVTPYFSQKFGRSCDLNRGNHEEKGERLDSLFRDE